MKPATGRKSPPRLVARFVAISWRDLAVSFGPIVLIAVVAIWLAVRLIQPAPPSGHLMDECRYPEGCVN